MQPLVSRTLSAAGVRLAILLASTWHGALVGAEETVTTSPDAKNGIAFTDVTESCGIAATKASFFRPWDIEAGEIDNDGKVYVYCMDHAQGATAKCSWLFTCNAKFEFSDLTKTAFAKTGGAAGGGMGVLFADLDGSGHLDLVTGSNDGVGCVFKNHGKDGFDWYTGFPKSKDAPSRNVCQGRWYAREFALGDVDGDGLPDLVVGALKTSITIYHNNGDGTFTCKPFPSTRMGSHSCTNLILADFTGNGHLDLITQRMPVYQKNFPADQPTSGVDLWVNDGKGNFTWESDQRGLKGPGAACALIVGDFSNRGCLDIVQLRSGGQGGGIFYANDGKGNFTECAAQRGLAALRPACGTWWAKAAPGDFNSDGALDICYNGRYVLANDGTGKFALIELKPSSFRGNPNGSGQCLVYDLNGDGALDIAGPRSAAGETKDDYSAYYVFRNDYHGNHWLKVKVNAGQRNSFGVGSKIFAYRKGQLLGYRQITCCSTMHVGLVAHFGLGQTTEVDLRVVFPDGKQAEFKQVKCDQTLELKQ
jgi:hypothetical protein